MIKYVQTRNNTIKFDTDTMKVETVDSPAWRIIRKTIIIEEDGDMTFEEDFGIEPITGLKAGDIVILTYNIYGKPRALVVHSEDILEAVKDEKAEREERKKALEEKEFKTGDCEECDCASCDSCE